MSALDFEKIPQGTFFTAEIEGVPVKGRIYKKFMPVSRDWTIYLCQNEKTNICSSVEKYFGYNGAWYICTGAHSQEWGVTNLQVCLDEKTSEKDEFVQIGDLFSIGNPGIYFSIEESCINYEKGLYHEYHYKLRSLYKFSNFEHPIKGENLCLFYPIIRNKRDFLIVRNVASKFFSNHKFSDAGKLMYERNDMQGVTNFIRFLAEHTTVKIFRYKEDITSKILTVKSNAQIQEKENINSNKHGNHKEINKQGRSLQVHKGTSKITSGEKRNGNSVRGAGSKTATHVGYLSHRKVSG